MRCSAAFVEALSGAPVPAAHPQPPTAPAPAPASVVTVECLEGEAVAPLAPLAPLASPASITLSSDSAGSIVRPLPISVRDVDLAGVPAPAHARAVSAPIAASAAGASSAAAVPATPPRSTSLPATYGSDGAAEDGAPLRFQMGDFQLEEIPEPLTLSSGTRTFWLAFRGDLLAWQSSSHGGLLRSGGDHGSAVDEHFIRMAASGDNTSAAHI